MQSERETFHHPQQKNTDQHKKYKYNHTSIWWITFKWIHFSMVLEMLLITQSIPLSVTAKIVFCNVPRPQHTSKNMLKEERERERTKEPIKISLSENFCKKKANEYLEELILTFPHTNLCVNPKRLIDFQEVWLLLLLWHLLSLSLFWRTIENQHSKFWSASHQQWQKRNCLLPTKLNISTIERTRVSEWGREWVSEWVRMNVNLNLNLSKWMFVHFVLLCLDTLELDLFAAINCPVFQSHNWMRASSWKPTETRYLKFGENWTYPTPYLWPLSSWRSFLLFISNISTAGW